MTLAPGDGGEKVKRLLFYAGWLCAVALAAGLLAQLRVAQVMDQYLQDTLTRLQVPGEPPTGITLIDIDERSLQELGPWPWPRPVLAQLSKNLRERGARLQVWDLFLPNEAPGDAALAQQLSRPDVVMGQVAVIDPLVESPPREGRLQPDARAPQLCSRHPPITGHLGLAPSLPVAQVGHLSATPDADGLLRRLPAVICEGDQRYPQLTLAAAIAASPSDVWQLEPGLWPLEPAQWLTRGPWRFALDDQGYLPIPYQRAHTAWPAISASRLLDPAAALPPLTNHIVLLGSSALGLGDTVSTPYHPSAPGVSVHAELLAAGLQLQPWGGAPPRGVAALAAALALLLAWAMLPLAQTQRRLLWLWLGVSAGLVAPFVVVALARRYGMVLPASGPALALLGHGLALFAWQTQQQRLNTQRLARHLESFLPPTLAHQVAALVPSGQSLGQPCNGVLVAVHIVGMDRWVSQVDSLQALALIHALHCAAQQSANRHGGCLEHAQGSTLYLTWPSASPATVAAALHSVRHLHALLGPALLHNETLAHPLSAYAAIEAGAYLLGIVGESASRRSVLLGPAANDVMGMLSLSAELASPILIGPSAAHAAQTRTGTEVPDTDTGTETKIDTDTDTDTDTSIGNELQPLGRFLLPDQERAKSLYRLAP
jgi:adenylate cyclase